MVQVMIDSLYGRRYQVCVPNKTITVQDLRPPLLKTLATFRKNTGIELAAHGLELSNDTAFCDSIADFVSFVPLLSHHISELFTSRLSSLQKTPHAGTACLTTSALLKHFWNSSTPSAVKLSQTILTIFLALLQESIPESIAVYAISCASPAFTFDSLRQFSPENLAKLLSFTIQIAKHATKSTVQKSLEMFLNILRAGTPQFVSQNGRDILGSLNSLVGTRICDLASLGVLNIVGELVKKSKEPSWFVSQSPISFHTLLPLFVVNNRRIQQRAICIFAVVVLGSAQAVDFSLVFSSLMSLYFGIEHSPSGYIGLATNLLEQLTRQGNTKKEELELLASVFEPILAVGDANCISTITTFLRFLKKVAQTGDEEISGLALNLMGNFAAQKQGFIARKSTLPE
jgi:hypothetical protein